MEGKKIKHGFTLLEIMLVLAVVGFLGIAIASNMRGKNPIQERKEFVSELNNLMSAAWYNGVTSGALQRIFFDFEKNNVRIEQQKSKDLKPGQEAEFEPLKRAYIKTSVTWPKHFQAKNFFIEGYDEVARYGSSGKLENTWFFIMPNGLTQDVVLNIVDMNQKVSARRGTPFSLVLNPFSAQFKEHKHFQNIK